MNFSIIKIVFNCKPMDRSHYRSVSTTHKVIPVTYTVFWSCNISKEAITKSTTQFYTCLMGPTEPLGCQFYGRAPAKAITKSLHCFTHFLRHSDGSWGTVITATEVSCIAYTTRGKQKSKGNKCKTNKFSPLNTHEWPHMVKYQKD